jgi:hypothetical protein
MPRVLATKAPPIGASILESMAGVGAVVMAILGLTRVLPGYMAAIGTVVVGSALFLEGAALAARDSAYDLNVGLGGQHGALQPSLGGAASAEVLGGIAGIVLGVLSLLGVAAQILLPAAAIVFGAALLVCGLGMSGAAATRRWIEAEREVLYDATRGLPPEPDMETPTAASLEIPRAGADTLRPMPMAVRGPQTASGAQVLVGLATVVLGILALLGISPVILTLVSLLSVGAAVLINGAAINASTVAAR